MRAPERRDVVVVGGGQAGLAVSWYLTRSGIDHVVLERDTRMHSWADARWDSFCLVTPNWQCRLPGHHYDGPEPEGFMVGKEIVDWLDGWLTTFTPPLREHTAVGSVRPAEDGAGFDVETSGGRIRAARVVVATGGYHLPRVPRLAERLPEDVEQVHSSRYRSPDSLPAGPVLVVGTGQSGAQIAEDLLLAGRDVHLAVGNAPRFARRYRGRDVISWMHDTGHYDKPVTDKPPAERTEDRTNHYVTGRDGGRDIDLRSFARQGMTLHGRLREVGGGDLVFDGDLERNLDAADDVYNGINALIDAHIAARGLSVPEPPSRYEPVWRPYGYRGSRLRAAELAAVVWATGFTRDYRWLHAPVFDGAGHPQHVRGVTPVPGLFFVGLPWLHTWGSGRFAGIERDAAHVAAALGAAVPATPVAAD
ncbi:putative flavoprotein involved in K+ transport [Jatrophihabitans endophyticus]|uniref:Putative flavoprotein involved in K+ transport n=1 Tax=Jatrophihabitans endophyticus TaxID=1206085 RepID=A0A1M5TX23_9ACTN|nr:MSMEG_0569 family flavin-dependent oxidoreductase [Jatrophihabitans endophyticus]SHH55375.1 putative flavoprotein involved in K+ transport [Jatrophihabitans endophyticus]